MSDVKTQIDTLNAIKSYNKGLKPARKKKDSLPEIRSAINIVVRDRQDRDHKKKTFHAGGERFYH